jgi:hypothetical protein
LPQSNGALQRCSQLLRMEQCNGVEEWMKRD